MFHLSHQLRLILFAALKGLFVANTGCENSQHSYAAFWQSTVENGAEQLRPELCPLGKYGFDPR